MKLHKWGGIASCLMPLALIASSWIYLTGNLREVLGPFAYSLADFLYGPVWAASLVTAVAALREHIGEVAPRRMHLALLLALAAACAFLAVACIRSANRQYHLNHPELHLEDATTVLIVWTTLVAGVTGTAWHVLGWALLLVGWSGWTSRRLPRALCLLYWLAGIGSLFVFMQPDIEFPIAALVLAASTWQGILLWRSGGVDIQPPAFNASQPGSS